MKFLECLFATWEWSPCGYCRHREVDIMIECSENLRKHSWMETKRKRINSTHFEKKERGHIEKHIYIPASKIYPNYLAFFRITISIVERELKSEIQ